MSLKLEPATDAFSYALFDKKNIFIHFFVYKVMLTVGILYTWLLQPE